MRVTLVFGASGSIGRAICNRLQQQGCRVIGSGRSERPSELSFLPWVQWTQDSQAFATQLDENLAGSKIDSVIWAQGINFNDQAEDFDLPRHLEMYEANVTFILITLQLLLNKSLLSKSAKLCVISSIWQNIGRQNKLSYCITKSALQGLIQSLSIDLGKNGILINAVLPGALDTEMTRKNLSTTQIQYLENATPLKSLPDLSDVTGLVDYLCSASNTGITGQFIAADRGFSNARIL